MNELVNDVTSYSLKWTGSKEKKRGKTNVKDGEVKGMQELEVHDELDHNHNDKRKKKNPVKRETDYGRRKKAIQTDSR